MVCHSMQSIIRVQYTRTLSDKNAAAERNLRKVFAKKLYAASSSGRLPPRSMQLNCTTVREALSTKHFLHEI